MIDTSQYDHAMCFNDGFLNVSGSVERKPENKRVFLTLPLGLRVTYIKMASGEKVYYLRILHLFSNTKRRRCRPDAVSFPSSPFQNESCAQSLRKCWQTTTTLSWVRKSPHHHRQLLAQVNLLPQFIVQLLHIIFRYQFL